MIRVFTFGCSFTSFFWPTWADIIINDFENRGLEGFNLGKSACSNQYIFIKFMEMYARFNFNKNDFILICWTSICREDRYIEKDGWVTAGNVLTQNVYPKEFNDKWIDPSHYYFRDGAIISSVKLILDKIGCNYHFFSMNNLKDDEHDANQYVKKTNRIIDYYGENLKMDSICMMDFLKINYPNRVGPTVYLSENKGVYNEQHPSPKEHLDYIEKYILPRFQIKLQEKTKEFVKEWIEKVDTNDEPIDPIKLKWNPFKKIFYLIDVIQR